MSHLNLDPDHLARFHGTNPRNIFVIMDKELSTVLQDPGLDRPWSNTNRKIAEHHARQVGGVVVPYDEAIRRVITHHKNLPTKN